MFVGGGFTGVEAAGEMADFFRSTLRYYPAIERREIDIVLVEGGKKLLPDLQAGMGEYSAKALERRGIRVLLETLVAGADDRGLLLKDGGVIATQTIVWSAGVKPSTALAASDIATGRRRHNTQFARGRCSRTTSPPHCAVNRRNRFATGRSA